MAERIEIIEGEIFSDHRGEIYSLNNFEFEDVKRAYIIHHPDKSVIRGWHAHKHERKWFYCIKGEWTLGLIKIDDWDSPSPSLIPTIINLTDKDSKLICVPAGYANCLKAKNDDAIIQVFSDVPLPEAYGDSWRYDSSLWIDWSEFQRSHTLNNIKNGKVPNPPVNIHEIYEYDIDSSEEDLDRWCEVADFVFNLAGINRPENQDEFMAGNFGFASILLDTLKKHGNKCPIMLSSSTQAILDNHYGKSKRAGELLMLEYSKATGADVLIYRFPNVFGKWCRPNYNSAVATFCHNTANDLPIRVNDRNTLLTLVYIDDLVDEMIAALSGNPHHDHDGICNVPVSHKVTLGEIVDLLDEFKKYDHNLGVPDLTPGSFSKKLYTTYLSYLPKNKIAYDLKMNCDSRGSFTEIIRSASAGQISVNISKPGIIKGQHWHHSKNEKFIVVKGHGLIQLRQLESDNIIDFEVNGEQLKVIQMLPGYTHNIINLSDSEDLITIIWCDENFNPKKPDTFFEPV